MAFYLLQEDGVSRILLEDLSGAILLEDPVTSRPRPIAPIMSARRRNRLRHLWWLPFLLFSLL